MVKRTIDSRAWTQTIAVIALVSTLLVGGSVAADGDPATDSVSRLFPYQGRLELDGEAFSGALPVLFTVYDADASDPVWSERQTVTFHAGQFQVLLGACDANPSDPVCPDGDLDGAAQLVDKIGAGDDLELSVTLEPSSGTVVMANRKRFYPVPFAHWSSVSADFKVGRNLDVAGNASVGGGLDVGGALSAQSASVSGALSAGGALSAESATVSQSMTVSQNLNVNGTTGVGLQFVQSPVSGGQLLCPAGKVPISHTVNCSGSGHGLWAVKYIRSGSQMGIKAQCWNLSSGTLINAHHLSLLCARIGPMPSTTNYTDPAWDF